VGGPIALVEDGDEIVVDLNTNEINCTALEDDATFSSRKEAWQKIVDANGGMHPSCGDADTRLLARMRNSAVSAIQGGGIHPGRELWVKDKREPLKSGFVPSNKYRTGAEKEF
jgi:dihydroxy-acid dehydratase